MAGAEIKRERDARVDFFRGLALLFIFIDHIPNNSWANATLKNFGFSDASEVFVLLAGYSAAIAYGINRGGSLSTSVRRAMRRAGEIYIWHIGIFIASAAILFAAAHYFNKPDYVDNIALRDLVVDPGRSLLSALALIYQPNQMNILPLYVVLMLWLPVVLLLLRHSVALTLIVSFAVWAIANAAGVNLPINRPGEGWYFNPLAWQLLFTTGAAAAVLSEQHATKVRTELLVLAAAYVVFAFLNAAPWIAIDWLPNDPVLPPDLVGQVSKNYLSVWRYLHILALAYLVASLVSADAPWLKKPWAAAIETCGKHSLEIFALGTLLSFLGWIALAELGPGGLVELMVNIVGLGVLGWTAWHLSRRKLQQRAARAAIGPRLLRD
jgi:hypothetical protein